MTRAFSMAAAATALLAACVQDPETHDKSVEAGTAAVYRNPALNPPPVGLVDHDSSVGTRGVHGTDVAPPAPTTARDAYGRPVVVAPAPAVGAPAAPIYYDAYGRPFYYDAYGRAVFVR
jgi:hypothetical protein